MNQGVDINNERREPQGLLARLNLVAAEQVLRTGAFKLASGFLETGIAWLSVLRWEMCYDLTLQLSITLASVFYSNGLLHECLELLDEIFVNAACPEDRHEAQSIQLEVLESMGQIEKCLQVGLAALADLGHSQIPIKTHLGHLLLCGMSAKKTLKHLNDADILNLPTCTEPRKEFTMRILNCLSRVAHHTSREEMMFVIGYRVLRMSLRYGVTKYSSFALCTLALSMASMGDFNEAFRLAQLSITVMERFPTDCHRTASVAYCIFYHLKKPIHECVNKSLLVYNCAFSAGDIGSAGMACMMHCAIRYSAGLPLASIAKDGFAFCHQLKQYQQTVMFKHQLCLQRAVLVLVGRPDEISRVLENGQDERQFESYVTRDGGAYELNTFLALSMEVHLRLGDMKSALEFAEKSWRNKRPSGFHVTSPAHLMFCSLTALQEWKRSRKQ